jgi:hypothetical protein
MTFGSVVMIDIAAYHKGQENKAPIALSKGKLLNT